MDLHSMLMLGRDMERTKALKMYFLPFFAPGHLIPFVQLVRLLASRGQQTTVITTLFNAQLFDKTIQDHIHVHIIKFPNNQVGLPEGVEHLAATSDNHTAGKIHVASHLIQPQVEAFLKQSPPDVFISDIMFTWSRDLANRLQIPRLVFNPLSIFDMCMIQAIKSHPEALVSDSGPYKIPGLPHLVTLPIKPSPGFIALTESLLESQEDSHGIIVNSLAELEVEYTKYYENFTGRKVWHVGLSSFMVQKTLNNSTTVVVNETRQNFLIWLDEKERNSVLYICFGSLCRLSDEQLYQIATGLEASGHKFLWVVHRKNKNMNGEDEEEVKKWLPEGFEERMEKEKRGILIKGWAPQPLILNHPAIGGFLTHCGWNSVTEAISAGVPMATMPVFSEQFFNEKFITEVRGLGVEVGAAEWSMSPYDGKKEVVSGERIEMAVKSLMDEGEQGKIIRNKAKEMKEKAWKAVEEGGSSHNSLIALIDHLKSLVHA